MTHDIRTPEEIEREIEQERSQLNRTMNNLQDRFSVDGLMRSVSDGVRDNGADFGRSVARIVQQNPAAVAVTGLGLAWLAFGSSRRSHDDDYYRVHPEDRLDSRRYAAYRASGELDDGVMGPRGPVPSGAPDVDIDSESPWDRASGAVADAGANARHKLDDAKAASQSRWERAKAEGRARGERARTTAHHMRERIEDGTAELGEAARKRVISARNRAYEAQVRAEYLARQGRDRAVHFYDDQPLVAGAAALAVGAAIGSALPRTEREDRAFGRYSDDLFDEAHRVYSEERSKLESVARTTATEAQSKAKEAFDEVSKDARETAEHARSKTKTAADDVADTAKAEAKKKDLGNVS